MGSSWGQYVKTQDECLWSYILLVSDHYQCRQLRQFDIPHSDYAKED